MRYQNPLNLHELAQEVNLYDTSKTPMQRIKKFSELLYSFKKSFQRNSSKQ